MPRAAAVRRQRVGAQRVDGDEQDVLIRGRLEGVDAAARPGPDRRGDPTNNERAGGQPPAAGPDAAPETPAPPPIEIARPQTSDDDSAGSIGGASCLHFGANALACVRRPWRVMPTRTCEAGVFASGRLYVNSY